MTISPKLLSALQSALAARWSVFAASVGGTLTTDFFAGNFATPQKSYEFLFTQGNWWTILLGGLFGAGVGAIVRGQQKAQYVGKVLDGTASSNTSVVYSDPSTPHTVGTKPPTDVPPTQPKEQANA